MKTFFKFTPVFALLMAALLWALPVHAAAGRTVPICTQDSFVCHPFPPSI